MIRTTTRVGTLVTESWRVEDADRTEAGDRDITLYRPAGTGIRNVGYLGHWMQSGYTYTLTWDGAGVRVSDPADPNHVRHLVDSADARTYVAELPTDRGAVRLDNDTTYEIRESAVGVWDLHTR